MQKNKIRDNKLPLILLLSFLIPAFVMCAVYFINGTDPFGNFSILRQTPKFSIKIITAIFGISCTAMPASIIPLQNLSAVRWWVWLCII